MDSKIINKEEWDSLKADPRFRKYRHYLVLWLEFVKDQWADGQILGEIANADASGKCQLLKDQIAMDYEDIKDFLIEAGYIKAPQEIKENDTE